MAIVTKMSKGLTEEMTEQRKTWKIANFSRNRGWGKCDRSWGQNIKKQLSKERTSKFITI